MMEEGDSFLIENFNEGVKQRHDNVKNMLRKLRHQITKYQRASIAAEKEIAERSAKDLLKQLLYAFEEFERSLSLSSASERSAYELRYEKMHRRWTKLKTEFENAQKGIYPSTKSADLFRDNSRLTSDQSTKSFDDGTQVILDIQGESMEKLDSMVYLNENTINIGIQASSKLKSQREKLCAIHREVDEIGTGLKRAQKEMRSFYRNVVCSKVIIVLLLAILLLVVCLIVARIILYALGIEIFGSNSIFKKKNKEKNKPPATPASLLLWLL